MSDNSNNYKTGSFYRRFFANQLDQLINVSICLILPLLVAISIYSAGSANLTGSLINSAAVFMLVMLLLSVGCFFIMWIFSYKYGGSVGKLLFGMRIIDAQGKYMDRTTAFWRMTAGYAVSAGFLFLGFFWIFRRKENLAWHDRIFDTKVIKVGSPLWGMLWMVLLTVFCVLATVFSASLFIPTL